MENHKKRASSLCMGVLFLLCTYGLIDNELLFNPLELRDIHSCTYITYVGVMLYTLYLAFGKLWINICANLFLITIAYSYFEQSVWFIEIVVCLAVVYSMTISFVCYIEQK